ncbi:5-oxoprolinase subunit B/C family protein [Corynebacterium renale]|uniref:5-oxoprolinase subunit B/C family protein n=1 Tax=Corynebacterium renale TaxID=1724 RepID=UPI000E032F26|nr:carboxyltransferase domain-containing protein [Corynebacterium renale]STC94966.1 allophanate hydrolase subunit 2 [Corynebacterium renale]
MTPTIHAAGSRALLVDLPDLNTVLRWHAALTAEPLPGQRDCVAAATTLLITLDSEIATVLAAQTLTSFNPPEQAQVQAKEIVVPVVYDGADLDEAAEMVGWSVDKLIEWHTATMWKGAFGGFAPGFTYCVPVEGAGLDMPRKSSPRTEVPQGAVGLAGNFSAVYPRTSPGGWQLLGTTALPMWDSQATPPAAIQPGDTVRYEAVREHIEVSAHQATTRSCVPRRPVVTVTDAGLQTLIEDGGRHGSGNLGVTTSGFADRASAHAANRVLGNQPNAAVLENIGGLTLEALTDCVIAVTGAQAPVTIDGKQIDLCAPKLFTRGSTLVIGDATVGTRNYVALRGGVIVAEELGSASTDVLSGLGPAPITAGDQLTVPTQIMGTVTDPQPNPLRVTDNNGTTEGTLRVIAGPRDGWIDGGVEKLLGQTWTVTAQSNRVGVRLDPTEEPLERSTEAGGQELASEGMVAGSIQVPPNGHPVLFLRDHAVTGGYPVVATVVHEDLDIAAQLPPGSQIRFVEAASPLNRTSPTPQK